MTITLDQVRDLAQHLDDLLSSDLNSEVRLGCDCGCGGDSYDLDSWEAMVKEYQKDRKDFYDKCKELGVEVSIEWQVLL